jgi:hypothetical protein
MEGAFSEQFDNRPEHFFEGFERLAFDAVVPREDNRATRLVILTGARILEEKEIMSPGKLRERVPVFLSTDERELDADRADIKSNSYRHTCPLNPFQLSAISFQL